MSNASHIRRASTFGYRTIFYLSAPDRGSPAELANVVIVPAGEPKRSKKGKRKKDWMR